MSLDVCIGESYVFSLPPVTASGGGATFNVIIPSEGNWALDAYVDRGEGSPPNCGYFYDGWADVTVVDVQPAPCQGPTCSQTMSGSGSAATVYAEEGTVDYAFFEPFDGNGCKDNHGFSDGGPVDRNGVLDFSISDSTSTKTIVFWLSANIVNPDTEHYKICWQSDSSFITLGGGTLIQNPSMLLYVGYLPKCGKRKHEKHAKHDKHELDPPSVLDAEEGKKGTAYIVIRAPPGDPKAYPE